MKRYFLAGVLGVTLASASVLAQEATDAQAQTDATELAAAAEAAAAAGGQDQSDEPDEGDEVICRRERVTGSLTRVNRICKTRDEWNGVYAATRDSMNSTVRNASGAPRCMSGVDISCNAGAGPGGR